MARRWRRIVFWLVGVPLMVGVAIVFLLNTPYGTRFVLRKALPIISSRMNGTLEYRQVYGSIFSRLDFRDLVVKDRSGVTLARADRAVIGFRLLDLVQGHFQVDPVILERPDIQLVQSRAGEPYPLMQVFAGKDRPASTARSEITVRGLSIKEGSVVATMPTRAKASGGEVLPGREPLLDTVRVSKLDVGMPLLRLASGGNLAPSAEAQVDEASAQVRNP